MMYNCYIKGWPEGVAGQGMTPGLTTPVPDEIIITWKTIRPGKEQIYEEYKKEHERLADKWEKATEDFTKDVPYPSIKKPEGIFDDHRVVLVLKGKVPKRPVNGEIIITYLGNEQFDVQYVQKK